jgi:predicted dehydrogenase
VVRGKKNSPLRAGIIGLGGIGRVHLEALRRIGVDVVAVAGSSQSSARRHAQQLDVPLACLPEELTHHPEVDVVHVCTTNNLHARLAESAIVAGKHVVCEKPLAASADEAWRLARLARERGVLAAVPYGYRYFAIPRLLRTLVTRGDLGDVHLVRGGFLLEEILLRSEDHWFLDPERMGDSITLADVGLHWWDLAEFVVGTRVTKVVSRLRSVRSGKVVPPGDDSDGLLMQFENGATGVAAVSHAAGGHNNTFDLELFGTLGSARWVEEDPDHLWLFPLGEPARVIARSMDVEADLPTTLQLPAGLPQGFNDAFRDLMASIYYNLGGHRQTSFPTFEDGAHGIAVLEAFLRSAKEERWISVPTQ